MFGYRLFIGKGVPLNYAEAVTWYHRAAEQGDKWAQQQLGQCYKHGWGATRDYAEAYKWLKLVAKERDAAAEKELKALISQMSSEQIARGELLLRDFRLLKVLDSIKK